MRYLSNEDKIRRDIGSLHHDDFEGFCSRLMAEVYKDKGVLNSGTNYNGIGTKGTPDAFIQKSNGRFIAFHYNTISEKNARLKKIAREITELKQDKCGIRNLIDDVIICTSRPVHGEIGLFIVKGHHLKIASYSFTCG